MDCLKERDIKLSQIFEPKNEFMVRLNHNLYDDICDGNDPIFPLITPNQTDLIEFSLKNEKPIRILHLPMKSDFSLLTNQNSCVLCYSRSKNMIYSSLIHQISTSSTDIQPISLKVFKRIKDVHEKYSFKHPPTPLPSQSSKFSLLTRNSKNIVIFNSVTLSPEITIPSSKYEVSNHVRKRRIFSSFSVDTYSFDYLSEHILIFTKQKEFIIIKLFLCDSSKSIGDSNNNNNKIENKYIIFKKLIQSTINKINILRPSSIHLSHWFCSGSSSSITSNNNSNISLPSLSPAQGVLKNIDGLKINIFNTNNNNNNDINPLQLIDLQKDNNNNRSEKQLNVLSDLQNIHSLEEVKEKNKKTIVFSVFLNKDMKNENNEEKKKNDIFFNPLFYLPIENCDILIPFRNNNNNNSQEKEEEKEDLLISCSLLFFHSNNNKEENKNIIFHFTPKEKTNNNNENNSNEDYEKYKILRYLDISKYFYEPSFHSKASKNKGGLKGRAKRIIGFRVGKESKINDFQFLIGERSSQTGERVIFSTSYLKKYSNFENLRLKIKKNWKEKKNKIGLIIEEEEEEEIEGEGEDCSGEKKYGMKEVIGRLKIVEKNQILLRNEIKELKNLLLLVLKKK